MKSLETKSLMLPVALLLLTAAIVIGYQVASAQNPVEPDAADTPSAPTGLTASWDVNGVMLEWTT